MNIAVQAKTIKMAIGCTLKSLLLFSPMVSWMFLMTDNLEKGSTIKLLIDSNGKNWVICEAILLFGKISKVSVNLAIVSPINQMNKKPMANADRFIKTPRNRQNEKKPTSLTK